MKNFMLIMNSIKSDAARDVCSKIKDYIGIKGGNCHTCCSPPEKSAGILQVQHSGLPKGLVLVALCSLSEIIFLLKII